VIGGKKVSGEVDVHGKAFKASAVAADIKNHVRGGHADLSGIGWSGIGWSGIGWSGIGWSGIGWSGIGWSGIGWSGSDWA